MKLETQLREQVWMDLYQNREEIQILQLKNWISSNKELASQKNFL